ncbi:MAG: hypothetical protein JWN70_6277, partial [Planctomycetaceae bacterium]|nr:hypothetical protein [Planctomycetaceae bacterium]
MNQKLGHVAEIGAVDVRTKNSKNAKNARKKSRVIIEDFHGVTVAGRLMRCVRKDKEFKEVEEVAWWDLQDGRRCLRVGRRYEEPVASARPLSMRVPEKDDGRGGHPTDERRTPRMDVKKAEISRTSWEISAYVSGEDEIRTRGMIKTYADLANRSTNDATGLLEKRLRLLRKASYRLAYRKPQKQVPALSPELTRLVAVWDTLPTAIRQAVLTLI